MNERLRARRRLPGLWLLGALAGASACEDPLTDPAWIAGPRIVGARAADRADPGLAEPAPGTAASLEWLVTSNEPGTFSARVAWCNAAPTVLGAPRCEGESFAEQSAVGRWNVPFAMDFDVPSELSPGGAWLAWLGICAAGEATFDARTSRFQCGDGDALSGFYRGRAPDGAPNRNPSLADDALLLDGTPWPALAEGTSEPAPGAACAGLGLPALRAAQPSNVEFELLGDDREELESPPDTYAAHPRESLVYTHLMTLPGLDRAFSAIDYDSERLGFEVPFELRDEPPGADGTALDFLLLVRDERGGVDWLRRQACLLPD